VSKPLLLLGIFIVLLGAGGVRASFGVFVHPLEVAFGVDRAQVAFIAALALLVFGALQPMAGWAIDRFGPGRIVPAGIAIAGLGALVSADAGALWVFGLLYAVVASAGFGAVSNAPLSGIVARHFSGRRGLALAVCATGTPVGQLTLAPTLALVAEQYGWRVAMAGSGLLVLTIVLPLALLLLRREAAPHVAQASPLEGVRQALATRNYWLLVGAYVVCGATTVGLVHTHLVAHSVDLGLTQVAGARVLAVVGLCNVLGLLFVGFASDRWGARVPLALVYGTRALALLWLARATDEGMLLAFALVFGFTDMATIPLTAALTAGLFGKQSVGALFGSIAVGHQVGSFFGAWLAGVGFTLLGSYQPVILTGAALAMAASLMAAKVQPKRAPTLALAER
jgi:MFS family permease